ncbi:MAG: hypothetical protein M9958_08250 [Chitinophagales bacterium]|nr:hypothetical protein [Chitinophagales bacterium]
MRITVVAASKMEILPLLQCFGLNKIENQFKQNLFCSENHQLHILITGIGMMQTASHLGIYAVNHDRDIYINAGVAGAFHSSLKIAEVVQVISERYGDFGVEDGDGFQVFTDLGFIEDGEQSEEYGVVVPSLSEDLSILNDMKKVHSLTVNKVHTNENTISSLVEKYNADIESMEGIAFFNVLNILHKRCLQIRSVSNYVGKPSEEEWNLSDSISSLNVKLKKVILNYWEN